MNSSHERIITNQLSELQFMVQLLVSIYMCLWILYWGLYIMFSFRLIKPWLFSLTVWMNDNCQTSQLKYYEFDDAIRLKANSFYPGTCKFTVAVSRSNHVIARFRSLDTPRKSSGVCKKFKLDIFDGPTADETKRLSGKL